jgi:hypothetical protein
VESWILMYLGGKDYRQVVVSFKYLEWVKVDEPVECFLFNRVLELAYMME